MVGIWYGEREGMGIVSIDVGNFIPISCTSDQGMCGYARCKGTRSRYCIRLFYANIAFALAYILRILQLPDPRTEANIAFSRIEMAKGLLGEVGFDMGLVRMR